jgi:hypothetical protein
MWAILADFDRLFAVVVAAVGMWATLLRCPHVHSGVAGVPRGSVGKAAPCSLAAGMGARQFGNGCR